MAKIVMVAALISLYCLVCTRGYLSGLEVGRRHSKEHVEALEADLIYLTDSLPDYPKRRFRENVDK